MFACANYFEYTVLGIVPHLYKDSGFEVRLWDFVASTVLYILPNMLMIVSIYTLISLIFKIHFRVYHF